MGKRKETSTNFENKAILSGECNQIYASSLISVQWTLIICCQLAYGKMRFSELKKSIPNITERMLTLQLRKIQENRLVIRTAYAEVPPRVEYELTAIGKELIPILEQLGERGDRHKNALLVDFKE
ncbi:winged helix-turn-helix transcriptional regulator [uncultured Apibacter sp.]|uniref:winged helix-turn-helix transcriptional regulator n=1 Tax=uncultured Apibacter sp. TaxID=1778616 RepID=UPI0025E3A20D|nr:winged helix-turn-helix transcriptional regulator [uncultured Apibacter sp.]